MTTFLLTYYNREIDVHYFNICAKFVEIPSSHSYNLPMGQNDDISLRQNSKQERRGEGFPTKPNT